jgi:hypothetical protein
MNRVATLARYEQLGPNEAITCELVLELLTRECFFDLSQPASGTNGAKMRLLVSPRRPGGRFGARAMALTGRCQSNLPDPGGRHSG